MSPLEGIVMRHVGRIEELPGINDWLDLAHIMMTSLPRLFQIKDAIQDHINNCFMYPDEMIEQWSRQHIDKDLIDCFHMFLNGVPLSEYVFTYYECLFSHRRFGSYAIVCTVADYYNDNRPVQRMTIDYDEICELCRNKAVREDCKRMIERVKMTCG